MSEIFGYFLTIVLPACFLMWHKLSNISNHAICPKDVLRISKAFIGCFPFTAIWILYFTSLSSTFREVTIPSLSGDW
jgi:hypothetical protein